MSSSTCKIVEMVSKASCHLAIDKKNLISRPGLYSYLTAMEILLSPDTYYRRQGVKKAFVILVMASFIMISGFPKVGKAAEKELPFTPGEKLTIQIKWCSIPAGVAVLEVLSTELINGVKTRHFVLTVRTSPFVDFFYKIRDRIDAFTDMEMTCSIQYRKLKVAGRKKNVLVNFNWEKNEAQYSNFGKKRKPIDILPGAFDPLAIFFAFRLHELKEGTEIERAVTDGKKCFMGKAKVLRREKIRVGSKTYDTFLVEPDLQHLEGVFEKSKKASLQVWVTADSRRLPVKVKSKVVVGSFVGELVSATGLKGRNLEQLHSKGSQNSPPSAMSRKFFP